MDVEQNEVPENDADSKLLGQHCGNTPLQYSGGDAGRKHLPMPFTMVFLGNLSRFHP